MIILEILLELLGIFTKPIPCVLLILLCCIGLAALAMLGFPDFQFPTGW